MKPAAIRLAELLRDSYWAECPVDVAKLANEVLREYSYSQSAKWAEDIVKAAEHGKNITVIDSSQTP